MDVDLGPAGTPGKYPTNIRKHPQKWGCAQTPTFANPLVWAAPWGAQDLLPPPGRFPG